MLVINETTIKLVGNIERAHYDQYEALREWWVTNQNEPDEDLAEFEAAELEFGWHADFFVNVSHKTTCGHFHPWGVPCQLPKEATC